VLSVLGIRREDKRIRTDCQKQLPEYILLLIYPSLQIFVTEWSEFESQYGQEFSLLHVVQTGSGAKPPIQLVPGALSPRREADHSPPTSADVKNTWIYTSTPPYAFMA
jgi:hypothetical protein